MSCSDLTICCVTALEPHAHAFIQVMDALACELDAAFLLALDLPKKVHGHQRWLPRLSMNAQLAEVNVEGPSLEGVLDAVVALVRTHYVLRLDDDEAVSPSLVSWLKSGSYRSGDNFSFPRAHLWGDARMMILAEPLWPDIQTRLSVREQAGGRSQLHAGSPHGLGVVVPYPIEHHKFLVRDYSERMAIARRYEDFHEGFGLGFMRAYNLPEDVLTDFELTRYDGHCVPAILR